MRYFIAAVRTVVEDACEESLRLVRAPQQPPREVLCATLSNDLDRLPEEIVLVLDDYHTIRNTEVHDLLGELVSHWPRPLHLVLVSRISPPIPLNSIRASGMLSELRTRDLRFRPEETAAYLSQAGEATFAQEALPLLQDRFEGWPAGLHLAVLSLKSQASQEALLSAVSSENPNITGYLIDEVLSHQSPAIRTFLVRTSILDRVCAPLSEAILGPVDSPWSARACLDSIERSELFISSVDDQRHWYRYHHLFQEMLQQRLAAEMSPDQVAELHRRASIWFQEQGLVEEALQHTLAAGDFDLAAHQMAAALREVINREDRPTLERWLRSLPEEMIERRPEMLMVRAWALEFSWQLNRQAHVLRQIEGLLDSDAGRLLPAEDLQILRGQILPLRAQAAYFANQPTQAIGLCQEALALLPSSWTFCRGGTMMYLGMALQASGESRAADRLLLDEYQSCADKSGTYAALVLRALCFNHLNAGRLEQARRGSGLARGGHAIRRGHHAQLGSLVPRHRMLRTERSGDRRASFPEDRR
jgi:LuxR family maltose regulon positive regulatory protein